MYHHGTNINHNAHHVQEHNVSKLAVYVCHNASHRPYVCYAVRRQKVIDIALLIDQAIIDLA